MSKKLILNRTRFTSDALKDWTFKEFQATYKGVGEKQEKEIFLKFGGKLTAKKDK